jgi:hypothetical protein
LGIQMATLRPILAKVYGNGEVVRWTARWRGFFLACSELFRCSVRRAREQLFRRARARARAHSQAHLRGKGRRTEMAPRCSERLEHGPRSVGYLLLHRLAHPFLDLSDLRI